MSPLVPGKPSSPCHEQKRSAHPSLTGFLTILHTKLSLFYFGAGNMSSPGECYRKLFIWRRRYCGMAHSPSLSLPLIRAKGVTSILQSISDFWEREDKAKEREMERLCFFSLVPSLLCFPSDLARRQRPVGKEQKASAALRESRHAASPPGRKYWPQAETLTYRRLWLSTQAALITLYTPRKTHCL